MVLTNYKAKNNASTTMASGISAGAVSMIVATGAGDLFPSTYPFELTLEQFTGSNVTKREIVKCTARTGDTLTIVRSAGYCPASYTALTQTNTAYAFSTGDTVSLRITANILDDINAELVRLEADKLDVTGSSSNAFLHHENALAAGTTGDGFSTWVGNPLVGDFSANTASFANDNKYLNGMRYNPGGAGYGQIPIMGNDGTFVFNGNKRLVITFCCSTTSGETQGFGIGASAMDASSGAAVTARCVFRVDTNALYARTANGTTAEQSANIATGITLSRINNYTIDFDPANSRVLYYINGTLVATHSTYDPSSATDVYWNISAGNGNGNFHFTSTIISTQVYS